MDILRDFSGEKKSINVSRNCNFSHKAFRSICSQSEYPESSQTMKGVFCFVIGVTMICGICPEELLRQAKAVGCSCPRNRRRNRFANKASLSYGRLQQAR